MDHLIDVRRTVLGTGFAPAKKFVVKGKRFLMIGGEQLMPAHPSRLVRFGRLLLAGDQSLDQRQCGVLRIGDDRNTADIAVVGGTYTLPPRCLSRSAAASTVIDADIAHPPCGRAHAPRLLRQIHQAANRGRSRAKQRVGDIGPGVVLDAPADNLGVERPGCGHVRCNQLVPAETPVITDQRQISIEPIGRYGRPFGNCLFDRILRVAFRMSKAANAKRRSDKRMFPLRLFARKRQS